MPDFTSQHRSKMSDPTRITKNQLERGQIARVDYKKADSSRGQYYVFVLQPKFKGYFHCIDLKSINPSVIKKLASESVEQLSYSSKVKKLDITKLELTESSRGFYVKSIRHKKLQEGYRTFIWDNIGSILVYNYDYGVFDRVATRAERNRAEGIRRDDSDAQETYTG